MGLLSKIWSGIKKAGSKIWGGINRGKDAISKIWGMGRKIPILGNFMKAFEDSPAGKLIKNVGLGVDVANQLGKGDVKGALGTASNLELKEGGVVNSSMMPPNLRIPRVKPLPRPIQPNEMGKYFQQMQRAK